MLGVLADFGDTSVRSLKLDTLVRLRWLAVTGQASAVLFVRFGLGFPLPLAPSFALIGASMVLNLVLRLRFSSIHRLDGIHATLLLGWDVIQLAGLLALTGGLENPFSCLLLAPVLVSSASLPPRSTALLGVLVAVLVTLLSAFHAPLPWGPSPAPLLPVLYVVGIWLALILALSFSALFAFRVADESRRLAEALTATELVLQREQHLTALDGLAAAAAHELGTPLGTIAVVTHEMERELPPGSPLADDIALLRSQSERCREILRKLSSMGSDPDAYFAHQTLAEAIEEVIEPFRDLGAVDIDVEASGTGDDPVGRRNPAILYGLGNIVENAVDFAQSRVTVRMEWDTRDITVVVSDDGPGFSSGVLDRLGEPWVTTRRPLGESTDDDDHAGTGGGLGLGFFIAQTFLMRSGARVICENKPFPAHGAEIRIVWPRARWQAPMEPIGASNF